MQSGQSNHPFFIPGFGAKRALSEDDPQPTQDNFICSEGSSICSRSTIRVRSQCHEIEESISGHSAEFGVTLRDHTITLARQQHLRLYGQSIRAQNKPGFQGTITIGETKGIGFLSRQSLSVNGYLSTLIPSDFHVSCISPNPFCHSRYQSSLSPPAIPFIVGSLKLASASRSFRQNMNTCVFSIGRLAVVFGGLKLLEQHHKMESHGRSYYCYHGHPQSRGQWGWPHQYSRWSCCHRHYGPILCKLAVSRPTWLTSSYRRLELIGATCSVDRTSAQVLGDRLDRGLLVYAI